MGLAQGALLGEKIKQFYSEVLDWIESQADSWIPFLPKFIVKMILQYGIEAVLDLTFYMTEDYIPQYFLDEIKGIADSSGIDYMYIARINMFPELIKAHCSMIGAWDSAVGKKNHLYHLRALDWATDGPFQKYASLLVYHPSMEGAHSFVTYGWMGFLGALTGISSVPVGISEKVWLAYAGDSSRVGIPWHFLLRDILQWDKTVDQATARASNAARTCSIFAGVGDNVNGFRAMEYSYSALTVFDDKDYPEYDGHPRLNGLVYINKHVQPSKEPCLGKLLQKEYGNINAETLIQVAAIHQTGDTHAAVYDYGDRFIYFVSATPFINGTDTPAYNGQWTKLSLDSLFSVKP